MSDDARSPEQVVEAVVAEAPDPDWLREVLDVLERRLHASELEWVEAVWRLSQEELARAFGVSTETLTEWARAGVSDGHLDLWSAAPRTCSTSVPSRIIPLPSGFQLAPGVAFVDGHFHC